MRISASASPIPSLTGNYTFYNNVNYGPYNTQVIDFFIPTSGTPTGIVIYLHGGGFVVGDQKNAYDNPDFITRIQSYLDNGIAYASATYRKMSISNEREGLSRVVECGSQLIDFLVDIATDCNLDVNKIGFSCSSGGNGPIVHHMHYGSVDLNCLYLGAPQATYDSLQWDTILEEEDYDILQQIDDSSATKNTYFRGLGIRNVDQLYTPSTIILRDYLNYLNKPLSITIGEAYLWTLNDPTPLSSVTIASHHYKHILSLKDKLVAAGVTTLVNIPNAPLPYTETNTETEEEFFLRKLT
tara:strand:+ start:7875 stop:8768 length:894 start_codon:yes stop_codon:yes gene_type:complete